MTGESEDEREARKKYLALACACDRVELALAWRGSRKQGIAANPLVSNLWRFVSPRWLQVAGTALYPLLPRKFRAAAYAYKLWRSSTKN